MLPVQIRIHIHHLRFHPDTKHHTQSVNLFRKPLKTSWKLFLIHIPIPEGSVVVIPVCKPAVIHNKKLDSGIPAFFSQSQKLVFIDVKIIGLPGIQQNGTILVLPLPPDHMVSYKPGHTLCHKVISPIRVDHNGLRRLEGLSRRKGKGKIHGMDTGEDPGLTVGIYRNRCIVIAAIDEIHTDALTLLLAAPGTRHHKEGVCPVRGGTGNRTKGITSGGYHRIGAVHLMDPGSGEV